MVLNAHDLELVISEDNIFAREVSLHDLNAIHDGVGLTGPLRVTLQSSPRFVTRYNFLRDQMSRVIISAEVVEDEPGADEPVEEEEDIQEPPEVVQEAANNDDTVGEEKGESEDLVQVEADQNPADDVDHVTSHEQVGDEDSNVQPDHDEGQPPEEEQSSSLVHEAVAQEIPEDVNKGTTEPASEPTNDHPEADDFDDFGSEDAIGEDDWLEYDETSEVPENADVLTHDPNATANNVDGNTSLAVSTGPEDPEESHGEFDHGSTESTLESDKEAFEDFDEVDAADPGLSVQHSEGRQFAASSRLSEHTDNDRRSEKSSHLSHVNDVSADLNNPDNSGASSVGDKSNPKDKPENVVETVDDFSDDAADSEWTQRNLDNPEEERQASPHDQIATDHTTTDQIGNRQLSKSSSKRSLDLAELDDDDGGASPPHSPGVTVSKRSRVE
ncbi:hypothetical protein BD410DRAFT_782321 [Rickenella mellea]|uniref:Uncharacterized protein n=1 Tax=Rickenella mellea TaxID=50990 RepID=A0A4Y7QHV7_9AGAM|nr:hypothetical protein BD410DRAFT_782321 [Rickenella mellea]